MKTFFSILFVFALCGNHLLGQPLKQNLRGRVIDVDTEGPLVGVTLFIDGSDPIVGTITDNDGYFVFPELPIGRYNVVVSYMGYENKVIPNLLLGAGKEVYLDVELTESIEKLDEVVVAARKNKGEPLNEMASVSARSISVEETQRFAGSFNDPSRLVSAYAGVTSDASGDNDIIIRGNSPRGMQWRIEGVDVPNPNHFANEGATGGPISILNNTTLSDCDFYTGAYPANYGDSYSGVFDIRLRKGNNANREFTLQAGILGVDLTAEGPFSRESSSSYLLNYRYSSLDLLNNIGIKIVGDAVPKFQDLTFNVLVPTLRLGSFQIFGVGGLSTIYFEEEDWKETYSADLGVFGINHLYSVSENTYLKTTLSFTGTKAYWRYHELEGEENYWDFQGGDDFYYMTYTAAMELTHKFSARHTFKTGITGKILSYDLLMDEYDDDTQIIHRTLDDRGSSELFQGFANWKYRPVSSLTFNTGVHCKYLNLNGNYAIEPRIGAKWQMTPRQAISVGYGIHSKTDKISIYLIRNPMDDGSLAQNNRDLDFLRAHHYVLGYESRITDNLNVKVETYYQDLFDVPVSAANDSTFSILNESSGYINTDLLNEGRGTNYGLELTVEKFFADNYYFLITGSLYESKYRDINNVQHNTKFNNNYLTNVVAGKEFPLGKNKNSALVVNFRGTYGGGQWYTPIDEDLSREAGYTIRKWDAAYSERRDDYMRFDLKISFRRNKRKTTRVWEIDIQNVTNTLNVTGDYWNDSDQTIETYTQMGILPVLNYRIEF